MFMIIIMLGIRNTRAAVSRQYMFQVRRTVHNAPKKR